MAKCFDSDDEHPNATSVASGSPTGPYVAAQGRPSAAAVGTAKPVAGGSIRPNSTLYSDDEGEQHPAGGGVPASRVPPANVPQFKRAEWQPPASQLPLPSTVPPSASAPIPPVGSWVPPAAVAAGAPAVAGSVSVTSPPPPAVALAPPPAPLSSSVPATNGVMQGSTSVHAHPPHPPLTEHPAISHSNNSPAAAPAAAPQPQLAALPMPLPVTRAPPPLPGVHALPAMQSIPLDRVPPGLPSPVPAVHSAVTAAHVAAQSAHDTANQSWEAFLTLRKQLEESHQRSSTLHAQVSQLQLTHEKEATTFRDAAAAQIDAQRKAIETTTEHYNEAQSKIENMTSLLNRKAEYIVKMEQKLHEATVSMAGMTQKMAHLEDRVRLSDSARQLAEVRSRELELTLEHSTQLLETLRRQLSSSHDDKVRCMQQQYELFEKNRQELVQFFAAREVQLVDNYDVALRSLQQLMEGRMADREAAIAKHWEDVMEGVRKQHTALQIELVDAKAKAAADVRVAKEAFVAERDTVEARCRRDMEVLEQRHREHEDHMLADIARRERELAEREQRSRIQRAQDEQDAKIALLAKEAEMKSYYEKIVDDIRRAHDQDREKLCTAFRDQVQQLSAQHLNQERELERLHREKEREMSQRYRIAGYENDDRRGQMDLQEVTTKTQSALLSKLDTIETRQRERAEQTRSALRASTSFSSVGVSSSAPSTAAGGSHTDPSSPAGGA